MEEISVIKELRKFGLTVGAALLIVALIFFLRDKGFFIYPAGAGILLVFMGVMFPRLLGPVHFVWMKISFYLGLVMTTLILGLLFYLVLTPVALTAKLFNKQFLKTRIEKPASSYWEPKERKVFHREDYERQY